MESSEEKRLRRDIVCVCVCLCEGEGTEFSNHVTLIPYLPPILSYLPFTYPQSFNNIVDTVTLQASSPLALNGQTSALDFSSFFTPCFLLQYFSSQSPQSAQSLFLSLLLNLQTTWPPIIGCLLQRKWRFIRLLLGCFSIFIFHYHFCSFHRQMCLPFFRFSVVVILYPIFTWSWFI